MAKKYRFLLMDADMTLLDFIRCERDALVATLQKNGCPYGEDVIKTYSEINDMMWKMLERREVTRDGLRTERFRIFVERLGFGTDPNKMAVDYETFLSGLAWMLPGARECLEKLRNKYKIYIITNGIADVQHGRIKVSGLDKIADGVFISGEIGCEKPGRAFFDRVAEKIDGFDKTEALVVGDSLSADISGAVTYGIDCCWLSFGREKPKDMNITYVTHDISGLPALLGED